MLAKCWPDSDLDRNREHLAAVAQNLAELGWNLPPVEAALVVVHLPSKVGELEVLCTFCPDSHVLTTELRSIGKACVATFSWAYHAGRRDMHHVGTRSNFVLSGR